MNICIAGCKTRDVTVLRDILHTKASAMIAKYPDCKPGASGVGRYMPTKLILLEALTSVQPPRSDASESRE